MSRNVLAVAICLACCSIFLAGAQAAVLPAPSGAPGLAFQDEAVHTDVPYVPTSQEVVEEMLKMASVKPSDTVIDLGCGDGRIVVTAAQKFGATARGVDINPERIKEANDNAQKANVTKKVKFVEGNLFTAEIKDASVVTLYLLPSVNLKLRPKLLTDLKPGTRIVSHSFDMGEWKPDKEDEVHGQRIYLWIVPPKDKIPESLLKVPPDTY